MRPIARVPPVFVVAAPKPFGAQIHVQYWLALAIFGLRASRASLLAAPDPKAQQAPHTPAELQLPVGLFRRPNQLHPGWLIGPKRSPPGGHVRFRLPKGFRFFYPVNLKPNREKKKNRFFFR